MPEVSYEEALNRLAGASHRGMRLGLDTTRSLLQALGNPERGLRGVLVAGTNGKGSVCAMVASIAECSGLRVALLTKPHLTSYRERIRLYGEPISEEAFEELVGRVLEAERMMDSTAGLPTHHELLTAMGFLAAAESGVDLTVCEVGLGGRLDATNVWDGGVAVLTSVGLDHQAQLGNTVSAIAREKAAIIKPGNLAVSGASGDAVPVVNEAARRSGARLWQLGQEIRYHPQASRGHRRLVAVETPGRRLSQLQVGLAGEVQLANAALAVAVADCIGDLGLPIGDDSIRRGLGEVVWAGRLEPLSADRRIVVDAAHNPHAVQAIMPDLERLMGGRRTVLIFGSMGDHDHRGMLALLSSLPFAETVFTKAASARAVSPELLAAEWPGSLRIVEPVAGAVDYARESSGPGDLILTLGSIYVVGEVMSHLGVGLEADPVVARQPLW